MCALPPGYPCTLAHPFRYHSQHNCLALDLCKGSAAYRGALAVTALCALRSAPAVYLLAKAAQALLPLLPPAAARLLLLPLLLPPLLLPPPLLPPLLPLPLMRPPLLPPHLPPPRQVEAPHTVPALGLAAAAAG